MIPLCQQNRKKESIIPLFLFSFHFPVVLLRAYCALRFSRWVLRPLYSVMSLPFSLYPQRFLLYRLYSTEFILIITLHILEFRRHLMPVCEIHSLYPLVPAICLFAHYWLPWLQSNAKIKKSFSHIFTQLFQAFPSQRSYQIIILIRQACNLF